MKDPSKRVTKAPWAKEAKPLINPGANDPVNFAQAVAFIVDQLKPSQGELRHADGRVRAQLTYAIKREHLRPDKSGNMLFGDLITWGCTKSQLCAALAQFPSLNAAHAAVNFSPLHGHGGGHAVPSDPAALVAALQEAHMRIHELEETNKAQAEELTRLRPLKIKERKKSSDGAIFGAMGGRPRKG